ncbi:MAG: low-specificity L-threonine aldolase [Burkholderiales bacterium]|nr:low-specificity L-threonine aldolase [Anaerolineae bacterium]
MDAIDLRSDTVTWPTPEMREAMANAAVGDDVWGDDPTVLQLEADAAAMLGKEAAVFVSSGTQGNLIAVMTHAGRGDEVILGKQSHTFRYEQGGIASLAGANPNTLEVQPDGTLDLDEIRAAIRATDDDHYPYTRLICLENTQGSVGGIPVSAAYTAQVGDIARANNLKLHIDGARFFNAAAALNTSVSELAGPADSVTFCLSKGLCAPVGSILVGSHEFITRARRNRKLLGGSMRQVGVLAAAGLISLHKMSKRLHEDHANARVLAEGLAQISYFNIDLSRVQTNMVFFELKPDAPLAADELSARLKAEHNILLAAMYGSKFRAVTHYWITRERVEYTLSALRSLLVPEAASQRVTAMGD